MKTELTLHQTQTRGWKMGLKNLLSRENNKWWGTSRWWIQTLVWGVITNGILLLLLFLLPFVQATFEGVDPADLEEIPDGITAFFSLAGIAMPIGVVILVQGAIISERELGTAEWVLSKPVSRSAFVLAKLFAHSLGILVTFIIIQSLIAFGLVTFSQGAPPPLLQFLTGVVLLALLLFFYLTLTLMMEVLANSRGLVLGVSLGTALGGALLVNLFPGLALVTPFAFPNMIPVIVQGMVPPGVPLWMPIVSTALLGLGFVAVTLWQFNKKAL